MELIISQSRHHFPAFPHLLKMSRQYRSSEKGRKMMRGEMIWKLEGSLCAWECNEGEELIWAPATLPKRYETRHPPLFLRYELAPPFLPPPSLNTTLHIIIYMIIIKLNWIAIFQEAHSCVEKAAMIGFVKLRILEPGFYLDHSFLTTNNHHNYQNHHSE